uniref:Uncharacterized protein n=1 Tax=Candidatus Kentrum sp. FM TaxID=2126340 RepID=A0A450WFL8_9GAMM|nr:MAG: hypothetical protein BECKFM1743C_GA0114222_104023 [Candidatus Kentron sp. FM]VFJ65930.1 MAG: hypothetical protein BECKFM1743A_GA0114220_103953 [Candidatus Kentron sp. FM]VFK15837.1 MAG: hypothetical protein BECKFM1743B_GA0114221_103903 [Candidatus Kentron sp. FM]
MSPYRNVSDNSFISRSAYTNESNLKSALLRHPTGNNLPTLLAYLSQILVQLLCCNDSYIVAMKVQKKIITNHCVLLSFIFWGDETLNMTVHYAPVCARS